MEKDLSATAVATTLSEEDTDSDDDYFSQEEVCNLLYQAMSDFARKQKEGGPQTEAQYNEFDTAMDEMALTFEDHVKDRGTEAVTNMMEGWISMESNQFSIDTVVSNV